MSNAFRLRPLAVLIAATLVSSAYAQDDTVQTEDITVFGQGQTRQVQNITKKDIEDSAPGSSPLKVLDKVPGVHFESSDTYGAYEWSTNLSVRGFSSSQLGYTLDDIPLGDLSYGNHNGLSIARAISSENIGRVQVSQGTGSLDTASTSNLGGTMQFYSTDPEEEFGVTASQMLGSDSARRTFVRLDTGRLSNGGKFYISGVDQNSDKWKGHGEQRYKQINTKYVQFFGESKLSAFLNWSDRQEIDYQDLSKEMASRLGYNWDNYYPDWQKAIDSANGIWTSGETSKDDAYYAGSGLRRDYLSGVTLDAKINDHLRWKNTVYNHNNRGAGLWWTPYVFSPGTTVPSTRTTEYDINRSGLISTLTYTLDKHKIEGGLWYENDKFNQARRYYANTAAAALDPYVIPSNPFRTDWAFNYTEKTLQWFAQDTITVSPRLTVNVGFKSPRVDVTGNETTGANYPSGTITSKKSFLPQVGMVYKLDQSNELFAGIAQNMRALYTQPFSTTQAGFAAIQGNLRPETSTTYEGGWRFHGDKLDGVLSLYHVDFYDRLLSISSGAGIVGNPSVLANVGKVESNGFDLGLNWKMARNWSWFNALSVNSTQYKDNYLNGTTVQYVSGKQVVGVPEQTFKTELAYDDGAWFTRLGGDYTSKRYYTYSNDNYVDPRWIWNLGVGYKTRNVGMFKEVRAQLNVNNLFNKQYFSSMGTNGYGYSDPNGTTQTLQAGAPRMAFFSVTGKF